ncbi:hypothetical protein pb186bvf_005218 [Paramecium bursaria]
MKGCILQYQIQIQLEYTPELLGLISFRQKQKNEYNHSNNFIKLSIWIYYHNLSLVCII